MVSPLIYHKQGWIEVITGCMFSGKTEELIRRVRTALIAKQKVQLFNSKIDTRYGIDSIISHNLINGHHLRIFFNKRQNFRRVFNARRRHFVLVMADDAVYAVARINFRIE